MIGAGMRVEGNLTFAGVLHIEGDVLGDILCDVDPNGTLVIGKSGNVTGTIEAPKIVVSGRVSGPVHSSASIEIQRGAHVAGDAFYKLIDIHAGGVIEGSLTPRAVMDGAEQERPLHGLEPPPIKDYNIPLADAAPAGNGLAGLPGGRRLLGGAAALLIVVVAIVLMKRDPAPITPPEANVPLKA
jgi:cytoskeletal protein CcmA (bactofilin family)